MLFGMLSGVKVVSHDLAAFSSSSSRSSALFAAYVLVVANTSIGARLRLYFGVIVRVPLYASLKEAFHSLIIIVSTFE